MLNLILFGAPGSGKGTQSPLLVEKYALVHISTGDVFRSHISRKTDLGISAKAFMDKGALVPDTLTVELLKNEIEQHPNAKGFIFDGFPRTTAQAEILDKMLAEKGTSISALIALDVPEVVLIPRLLNRGKTSARPDDQDIDIVKNRLATYERETSVVAQHYAALGKAHKANGVGEIGEILKNICQIVDNLPR